MVGVRAAGAGIALLLLLGGCTAAPAAPQPTATSQATATSEAVPVATATVGTTPAQPLPPPPAAQGTARAFFLDLTDPLEDTLEVPAGTAGVTVAGRTVPGAVVTVNGALAEVDENGLFRLEVRLEDEVTVIEVVASDREGREVRIDRVVVQE